MSGTKTSDPTERPPDRRKLVAVVYADMVGYSRLIGLDDTGTLERLRALRREVIDPAIDGHGGKIVQTGGDSLLIVFDSIDGAVRCAMNVQQRVPILDGDHPSDRAIRFRIGINLGDAITDGTDLHGDAVNVAARIQAECPPGGICVTRAVRDHVRGRHDFAFEELGSLNLKNIAQPVETFVVRPSVDVAIPKSVEQVPATDDLLPLPAAIRRLPTAELDNSKLVVRPRSRKAILVVGGVLTAALVAGGVIWWVGISHLSASLAERVTTQDPALALATPPEERETLYEAAWQKGGLQFRATFEDLMVKKAANDTAADFIRRKIREIVKDPATAAKLSDIDHPYATKRPPIDTNYFETFNRDNVTLVDVKVAPIERITPSGIRTSDAEYPLDIIVFATGFDAMTGPMLRMNITGRDGISLAEAWEAGPLTYLGLQIAGFPNLFTVTGPGSPSVLCNMPVAIEQHADWIADCIAHMRAHGLERIEATPEAVTKWVEQVNTAASATLLPLATSSWYLGANVPGKPRVFMPYAGGMVRYRNICADVAANNYEGFTLSG